jgi:REP element-mobilizing transposase RayT
MGGHRISNQQGSHFLTFTTVDWIDIFTRRRYRDILIDSLKYCQKHKGLIVNAYVIMSNHVHLIAKTEPPHSLSDFIRDFKKFTSTTIVKAIKTEPESRRKWLLDIMAKHAKRSSLHQEYQLWQRGSHPVELHSLFWLAQKVHYIHLNPVRAGWVEYPPHFAYSSALYYETGEGFLNVVPIPV